MQNLTKSEDIFHEVQGTASSWNYPFIKSKATIPISVEIFLLFSFVIPSFKGCGIGKLKWNANVVRIWFWFFNCKHASITFMSIYDIFSSYVMSIYSYIMQGMLMTPTNPAYLYAFQNRTLLLVCRMHLCFPISTSQLILLQNHPFLVSCELLKVAILL